MSHEIIYIGVDVSKHRLDVYYRHTGNATHYPNTNAGIAKLLETLDEAATLVVLEATGGYEKLLYRALHSAGIAAHLANARKVRDYARCRGILAKTDKLDASVLACYAATLEIGPDAQQHDEQHRLKSLVRRLRQLARQIAREKTICEQHDEPDVLEEIQDNITNLKRRYADTQKRLEEQIAADHGMARRYEILKSCKGVGPFVAGVLMADMPELGHTNNRQARALGGLAPYNNDSGPREGERHVCHGRERVRQALYQAALSACRHNPDIKAYYERKCAEGKQPKKAQIACAAKLLNTLNALLRDDKLWQP